MSLFELFLIALGLSMDAFAVSICKGLSMPCMRWKHAGIIGLWFGSFQALMPAIGYFLGYQFRTVITRFDHWIAFILLGIIGFNMAKEAFSKGEEEMDCSVSPGNMALLAIATSIDALAIGVTFAFLNVQIVPAVSFIGIVTFALSIAGVRIGNVFGIRYKSKAELAGGIILITMGLKILIEHLFF